MQAMTLPSVALSIRQPWCWAIFNAGKDIENRDWPTRFRGGVLIHASKGMTKDEYADASDFIGRTMKQPDFDVILKRLGIVPPPYKMDRGGIIGVVEIVDCIEKSDSPWFFGRYGFVIRNARPLQFTPCKGALGFFKPAIDVTVLQPADSHSTNQQAREEFPR